MPSVPAMSSLTRLRPCETWPKTRPAAADPTAYSARMAPAALGAPRSCETASVTTSLTPKIAPVITMMKASGTSPGTGVGVLGRALVVRHDRAAPWSGPR